MSMQMRNIGDLIKVMRVGANAAATAGGSGDASKVTGVIIDRASIGTPQSGVLAVPWTATLAEDKTLSLTYTVVTGAEDDLGDGETLVTDTVVLGTGGSGGSTESGCFELDLKLAATGRYVRIDLTPDLSATGTDTAALAAVLVCGGMDRLPQ